METLQNMPPPVVESLSQRLKRAYKRVSPNLRTEAAQAFSRFHRIHQDTFRKKCNGDAVVTEQECEWMEAYRPSQVPVS